MTELFPDRDLLVPRTSAVVLIALLAAPSGCKQGPPPEQVRLELPELSAGADPMRAIVRGRTGGTSKVLDAPYSFTVAPPDVAEARGDGTVVCTKSGDARITVSVQGVEGSATLRCRLVERIEVGELPLLDIAKGRVALSAKAFGKGGRELGDVPLSVTSERPTVLRATGLELVPVAVGETSLLVKAGGAQAKVPARVVRTLDLEALPLDGGRRVHMSLSEGKYEVVVTLRREHALAFEWRGAPYCNSRSAGRIHRASCVLRSKGGVVFDNPAFLEAGSTDPTKEGVELREVP